MKRLTTDAGNRWRHAGHPDGEAGAGWESAASVELPEIFGPFLPDREPDALLVRFALTGDARADRAALRGALSSVGAREVEALDYRPADPATGEGASLLTRVRFDGSLTVDAAAAVLSRQPGVVSAESNWIFAADAISNDPSFTSGGLWGMYGEASSPANPYGSQAAEAWASGYTGSATTVVGVIDTGIDYRHPDLYLNIWINQGEIRGLPFYGSLDRDADGLVTFRDLNSPANAAYVSDRNANGRIDAGDLLADSRWENGVDDDANGFRDDLVGWDFVNGDNDPLDDNSHGTHVAGTIGGIGANGLGVAGVNWSVQIVPLKFLSSGGSGTASGAIAAINYFTGAAARAAPGENFVATNNSWAGGGYSTEMRDAISAGARQGLLFVAAAGNSSADIDVSASYPASYSTLGPVGFEAVVSVASISSTGTLSSFSNYGDVRVDLGAPGSSILSTTPGAGYGTLSGTSMATPHVTGAIALFASANPDASAAQIRAALLSTVTPTASLAGKTVTGGRLDIGALLQRTVTDPAPRIVGATPADGAVGVGVDVNLVVSFSEDVRRGAGTVEIRTGSADGPLLERFDAALSTRLTVSGAQLTIDPTANLASGQVHYVTFSAGAFQDLAGNPMAASSSLDFRTDDYGGGTTTNGAIGVPGTAAGVIDVAADGDWFRTTLTAGQSYVFRLDGGGATPLGNPWLGLRDATGALLASNDDADAGTRNSALVFTATRTGTHFIEARASGNTATGGYTLSAAVGSDIFAPQVLTFSPADGAASVGVDSPIVLSFNEAILRGTGAIALRSGSASGTLVEAFDAATSARISITGSTLTVDPTVSLAPGTAYWLVVPAGAVRDQAGNAYAGTSAYDFTTLAITLTGSAGNDTLTGSDAIEQIRGLGGADVLNGKGGVDTLDGGDGSDIYLVTASAHHEAAEISDSGSTGTDELRFAASSSIGSAATLRVFAGDTGLERVVIGTGTATTAVTSGTAALNIDATAASRGLTITGNAGANQLLGGSYADILAGGPGGDNLQGRGGADVLRGGDGNDVLRGGAGSDDFVFDTAPNGTTNRDTLPDFAPGADALIFSRAVFTGLAGNSLGDILPGQFRSGAGLVAASDADDRFLYDTTDGSLRYDADGTGASAPVVVAVIGTSTMHPLIDYTDIAVTA